MLSSATQVNTLSYVVAQSASFGNRSYISVSPNQYLYAQFEYVAGVPNTDGGVSISKLQILNSLIDHLMQQNSLKAKKKLSSDEISYKQLDKLITEVQKKMQASDKLSKEIPYAKKALEPGAIFSLQV